MNVYIFSIKRAVRRQNLCKGGLMAMGVPYEDIKIFLGPDHRDYKTWEEMIDAMISDGFTGMKIYRDFEGNKAILGQRWGYCQLFRQIQEKNETAMYVHDDALLTLNYHAYLREVSVFEAYDPAFKILGLSSSESLRHATLQSKDYYNDETDHKLAEVFIVHNKVPTGMDDFANIVTPKFSEWFFTSELFTYERFMGLDEYFRYIAGKKVEGFYCFPEEISAARFPPEVTPSMIFDTELLKIGIYREKE